ncbi:Type II secretion system (T2SS), protein F [uncultured archaeon]|nr:Type II secretion system (T2SS), protein F [uncultured archaeon]
MADEAKTGIKVEGKPRSKAPQPLVAQPLRDTEGPRDPEGFRGLLVNIASKFPSLKKTLTQAEMGYTPAGYVRQALISALLVAAVLIIVAGLLLRENPYLILILIIAFPVLYALSFLYFMQFPSVKAKMRAKRMEQELVFAGRHMLIELKSGVPLFDSMLGISRDYGPVSEEFNKIVEKVTLGVPMGVAMHDVADNNPSPYFKRMVLQMANSLASGSDVGTALEAALDQISREQAIELKAYGQKLNPIVMFYMIFGIIMPSLGVAFLIILASFLGGSSFSFGSSALFGILIAVGLVQFIFLSMVENSRPKFDIV